LVARGYVDEIGHDPTPGNPSMFATSRLFLERLGLNSLSDLPALADFVPEASIVEALERGLLVPSGADDVEVPVDEVEDGDGGEVDESTREER
jgi:segregation and condensation protein B